jgi:hypothetical protein
MLAVSEDECIDRRFSKDITGQVVKTVPEMGWAGSKNGNLLTLAQEQFDIFLTVDRNLEFQLNLPKFDIAIIILQSPTNRPKDLRRFTPKLEALLQSDGRHNHSCDEGYGLAGAMTAG